jgi:predicted thioredoxin/glutaredoxin
LASLILSVPWVKIGYTVVAADPVSGEEVEAMIRGFV